MTTPSRSTTPVLTFDTDQDHLALFALTGVARRVVLGEPPFPSQRYDILQDSEARVTAKLAEAGLITTPLPARMAPVPETEPVEDILAALREEWSPAGTVIPVAQALEDVGRAYTAGVEALREELRMANIRLWQAHADAQTLAQDMGTDVSREAAARLQQLVHVTQPGSRLAAADRPVAPARRRI